MQAGITTPEIVILHFKIQRRNAIQIGSNFQTWFRAGLTIYNYERDYEGFQQTQQRSSVPKIDRIREDVSSVPSAGFEPWTSWMVPLWSQTLYGLIYADFTEIEAKIAIFKLKQKLLSSQQRQAAIANLSRVEMI